MFVGRRDLIATFAVAGVSTWGARSGGATVPVSDGSRTAPFKPILGARCRVLYLNDLAGDVDGLFSAVHMVLSPSIDVRGIVGTATGVQSESAERAVELAHEMLQVTGLDGSVRVSLGATGKLKSLQEPDRSPGVAAIIDEAKRTDSNLPLYVAVGGGLTEVASALLLEPEIASKFTLIWIGGAPYSTGGHGEYNFEIDPLAAQHIFNDTDVPIWQVPSSAYATCQISFAELQTRVAPRGRLGAWLYQKASDAAQGLAARFKLNTGETWTLGDSPLVLVTALTSWPPSAFTAVKRYETTGSSAFDEIIAPKLGADGSYEMRSSGRKIRVYKTLDTRLMFNDLFAKLELAART
jgi:hypothetical protein